MRPFTASFAGSAFPPPPTPSSPAPSPGPHGSGPSRFGSLFAATVGVACSAALALPLVLLPGGVAHAADAPAGGLQSLPLQPLKGLQPLDAGGGADSDATGEGQGLPATGTEPFSLLGVVWTDADAALRGQAQVRTRAIEDGTWSAWQDLETDPAHTPDPGSAEAADPGVRGGTAPLWVGPSDGVQVRVVPDDGSRAEEGLPEGLSLELIDTGQDPAPEAVTQPQALLPAAAASAEHEGPRPPIVIRSGWGADEGLRESGFVYTDTVKTVFVHHTAGTNDYACSEAPSILRGIYRYHVESQGWRDVGYNFFVDRCGTIYEGRAGGVAEPVQGAHTLGFNHNSMGVAVIGTYSNTKPNKDITDNLSLLTAWKLGLHGGNPEGARNRTSSGGKHAAGTTIKLNNISGHRDAYNTDCPGGELQAALGTVRSTAARLQGR
ncbi:peptidoglycan recognition protein [Streptomyces avicenniae]|uniref:peptidoglycan recognition protein family protein n=1 Tax=Streptomyces avicenniae TaxID=500153 RepID=UPI000A850866|nr:N-acetylmuramoyl-L-alanine amidase [Streptomyces avicenniae]